ncbi:MAG: biotin/lipoyl-binding protein, partial [Patescibacteria group bacterium]
MFKKLIKFLSRHKIVSAIVLIIIIVAGYFGYKSLGGVSGETRYVLAAVEKGTVSQTVSGTGQVSASNQLDIKPSVSGNITKAYVIDGQAVKVGDLLFQIDSQDAQKAVKDAQASLDNARISLAKLQEGSTDQDIANSELQVDSAQNSLTDAQNNLIIVNNKANQDLVNAYLDAKTLLQDTYNKVDDILNRQTKPMFINNGNDLAFLTADSQAQVEALSGRSSAFDTLEKLRNISENLPTDNSGIDEALVQVKNYLIIIQSFCSSLTDSLNSGIASGSMTQTTIDGYKSTVSSARSSASSAKVSISAQEQTIANQKTTNDNNILTAKNKIISSQNALAQAQNNLTTKKASADPLDVKSKQIAVNQALASLSNASSKLSDYTIKAPFDGIVTNVVSISGYDASANTVLATVITPQQIAEISLNEVDAANVKMGQ